MEESMGPKVISTLTVNYKPAIDATRQLMDITAQLDNQLRSLRITATDVGRNTVTQFNQPLHAGQVILDRHGKVLVDVGAKTKNLAEGTKKINDVAKDHVKTVNDTSEAYSVLGSQWERRISWFIAGAGFYGFIRVMRQAIDTFRQIEADMTVIARITNDVTFNLEGMRDALQNLGMGYGHTWETVSDVAIRWTQAGYNMQDTLEQTRVGLLALNVAEMDVDMASQGLIAIMSQWGYAAEDLETVIDKLNVTSDNYAVTTGDLVEALIRSSGAARAVGVNFEETIGIITAMRVATGRTGREVGNAVNTILSYLMRQKTINKLMESGVEVFADAAQTKLRPAMDILADIAVKWGDKAEEMPEQMIEIAEQMGLMSEEMADVVGLQQEWTDLQKIDIETAAAGVRRRSYLIALLRNFAEVQDVVNGMYGVEGYSMRQNIMTMETLDKKYQQLQVSIEQLAVAIGDAGLKGQLVGITESTASLINWFNGLDKTVQMLVVTFGELVVMSKIIQTVGKMMGISIAAGVGVMEKLSLLLKGIVSFLGGPYVAAAIAATAVIVTLWQQVRKNREEHELYVKSVSATIEEMERLDSIMERSVEGSTAYNFALEQKREIINSIKERYPELIDYYDEENRIWVLNNELLEKNIELYREMVEARKEERRKTHLESMEEEMSMREQEVAQIKEDAKAVERLFSQRENLIRSMEEESLTAEEASRRKEKVIRIEEAIIRIIGEFDKSIQTSEGITKDAIDGIIEKYRQKAYEAEESVRRAIEAHKQEALFILEWLSPAIDEKAKSLRDINREIIEENKRIQEDSKRWVSPEEQVYMYAGMSSLEAQRDKLMKQLDDYEEKERDHLKTVEAANKALNRLAETTDDYGGGSGDAGKEMQKLIDIINKFIETALRAANVQGMINNETQRAIDGYRAKIEYMTRDNATAWERAEALRLEAELTEKLREKQEGVHQEANFLREALAKLEQRQASINISTDEGWEVYKKLESQIESIKDSISKLDIEWFALAEAQEGTVVQTKKLQDEFKQLDFYARLGVMSTKELVKITKDAYSEIEAVRALTITEERDRINRLSGYYKDIFRDILKEAESVYKERVKALERSVEEEIEIYKRMLESLEEEKQTEDREEAARQHVNKMKDLYEQRRYHELRTGIEHYRAIEDLDKDIAEEERHWELQQNEWLRKDKRDAINKQIEDIKAIAKEQREIWEQAYEIMREDFNDHNLALLSTASAYDQAFFEDAYRKATLWIEGFRTGLLGAGDYIGSLVGQASGIVFPKGTQIAQQKQTSYTIEHSWGHTYTVAQGGHAIYKDGRLIPAENFKYLPTDILQLARDMKAGKAHSGAATITPGIAELIPGELIFPPGLSIQLGRLIKILSASPLQGESTIGGRINNFYAPLYSSEKTIIEDEADIELYARAIKRQILSLD